VGWGVTVVRGVLRPTLTASPHPRNEPDAAGHRAPDDGGGERDDPLGVGCRWPEVPAEGYRHEVPLRGLR